MSKSDKPKLVVILGPTAAGKTNRAITVAKKFNGEIVCADSRTVYREMNIGTSKPTTAEQRSVPHHLLDVVNPDERYTLADWQRDAFTTIDDIITRGKQPFLVGGTGLYLSSIIEHYDIPGKTKEPKYDCLILGLHHDREKLYERINDRVVQMIAEGLEQEITQLKNKYSWKLQSMHGIGYREWKPYFEKKKTKEEVINDIQQATRNFAKRQMTWFRGMEKKHTIHWVETEQTALKLVHDWL